MLQAPEFVECGFCDAPYRFKSNDHDTLACAAAHAFTYTPKFTARLAAMDLPISALDANTKNLRAAWDDRQRAEAAHSAPISPASQEEN